MRIKIICCFILILFLFTLTSNIVHSKKFNSNQGFILSIPDSWIEIPKNVLEAYSKSISKIVPDSKKQIYDFGFQQNFKKNWFKYPYILLQVKNTGRIPEATLKKMKKIEMKMAEGATKAEQYMPSIISKPRVGETLYDERNHILWSTMSFNVKDIGPTQGLIAVILTERGTINLFGYSIAQEYNHYSTVFQRIAQSISFTEPLRYKPRLSDYLPGSGTINWRSVAEKVLIGAIIGAIIAAVAGIFRKKKETNPNKT